MKRLIHPPSAPAMMNSLRAIGYSFEAALADIVDNSIAARATVVDLQFRTAEPAYLAFADDGIGMTEDRLIEAMRHGGVGPDAARRPEDLGRFGLGLKTATLSQCRRLTVVSRTPAGFCGARWDLDEVERSGDWALDVLSDDEARALPQAAVLASRPSGTVVIWENFDRALAGESAGARALEELMDEARDHLALVFHRYLSATDGGARIDIAINNVGLAALDPFLRQHRSTRPLPAEVLTVDGADVTFTPFILPHFTRLDPADLALAGGEDGLRRGQGFYVYRARRLITSGTWFRLVRQEELTKLARVQIDIPNTLDHLWSLDVKKSVAQPPEIVRTGLRRIVERIAETSRHVYRFRGRRTPGEVVHLWERVVVRGGIDYVVNRAHPLVRGFDDTTGGGARAVDLERLLRALELSLPTDALYADLASERRVQTPLGAGESQAFLRDLADRMLEAVGGDAGMAAGIIAALPSLEPFSSNPAQTARVIRELTLDR